MKTLFKNNSALYLITDRTISSLPLRKMVRQAITAGIRTIQIREKNLSKKELFTEIQLVIPLFLKYNVTFIINDYVDIALAADADGVHLGQEDMPVKEARRILGRDKIIGISTHNLEQALEAERAGADYIGFGPVFKTLTKDAGRPKGIDALREIRKHIRIPVVAIGGIAPENASLALEAGADAVAVISGILSGNIKTNVKKFLTSIKTVYSPRKIKCSPLLG